MTNANDKILDRMTTRALDQDGGKRSRAALKETK
jgi:hypothetical protein